MLLHACDIATDFAIHTGIRLNAFNDYVRACCHKELRPQPIVLKFYNQCYKFGIHAGQQAEMLTDTLRALLLKAYGYETKVLSLYRLNIPAKIK